MPNILACIDGSHYTASVCEYAAWAAQRLRASVTLLHVHEHRPAQGMEFDISGSLGVDDHESLLEELTALDEERGRLAQRHGQLILNEARSRVSAADVSEVVTRQRHGVLVDNVTELEDTSDLVVLGKRGVSAEPRGPHLGGNLERVVRSSHKPVLVAPRAFQPVRRFLIAFDGGASIGRAIEYISQSPLLRDVHCHVLAVADDTVEEQQRVTSAVEPLVSAGYSVETSVKPGRPDQVIAAEVDQHGIDLIVMGAYSHSRFRTLIIGSTTTATLLNSRVPVLMFRA